MFDIISDLHLECKNRDCDNDNRCEWLNPKSETLILAGDVGNILHPNFKPFFTNISQKWKLILYVLGNHEYMHIDDNLQNIVKMYKTCLQEFDNVKILDDEVYENDEYLFIGSTLWSDIPLKYKSYVYDHISDFKRIKSYINNFYLYKYHHLKSCAFLDSTISNYSQNKKIVVITHHAPYDSGTSHPRHESKDMGAIGYSTNLSEIFKNYNLLWIFGHTHWKCNFKINNTQIVNNPMTSKNETSKNETSKNETSKLLTLNY